MHIENLKLHSNLKIQLLHVGNEQQPVMIVDNFLATPEALIDYTMRNKGGLPAQSYYPGVRAPSPTLYSQLMLDFIHQEGQFHFELSAKNINTCDSYFAMVTTPVSELSLQQSVPHFDSPTPADIADDYQYVAHPKLDRFTVTSFYLV